MRITVSGYYGYGNTGDEAVLAGIIGSFRVRAAVPRESFVVLSGDVESTRALHGVRAEPRMRLSSVRRALKSSDLLISGGGSLIQDATSVRSAVYYLAVLRLAAICGTPAMIYAQGVGPLRRRFTRSLTRMAFSKARCVTVRDGASKELLDEIGVRGVPIEVLADPAFALEPVSREESLCALQRAGVPAGARVAGFALRTWPPGDPMVGAWARMIDDIAKATGLRVLLLPMQPSRDMALASRIAAAVPGACLVSEALSPRESLGLVGALAGMVAMRLHALIFAVMGGVATLAIGYDPKVGAFMRDLGQDDRCLDLAGFDPARAASAFAAAVEAGADLRRDLLARAADMRERALLGVDRAMSVAGGAR